MSHINNTDKGALKKVILGIACFGLGMIAGVIITPQEIVKTETIIKEKEVEKPRNEIYQDCYVQTVRVFGDTEKTGWGEYRYHAKNIDAQRLETEIDNCINNYYE